MKPRAFDDSSLHPSFLALDRAHLGQASPQVSAHLADCEACRSYVAAPEQAATAMAFSALQRTIELQKPTRLGWLWAAAPILAVACGVFLFVTRSDPSLLPGASPYVGAKGFRSVWIYVKRGADTELWDGKRPFSAGDRIRLKVDPGSYRYLSVYTLADPKSPERLYGGPLSAGQNFTLPEAWELDDSLAPERLYVVFSDAEIAPVWQEWLAGQVPSSVALLPFSLPKAAAVGSDAGLRTP